MTFRSEPSGRADKIRPAPRSRKNIRAPSKALFAVLSIADINATPFLACQTVRSESGFGTQRKKTKKNFIPLICQLIDGTLAHLTKNSVNNGLLEYIGDVWSSERSDQSC